MLWLVCCLVDSRILLMLYMLDDSIASFPTICCLHAKGHMTIHSRLGVRVLCLPRAPSGSLCVYTCQALVATLQSAASCWSCGNAWKTSSLYWKQDAESSGSQSEPSANTAFRIDEAALMSVSCSRHTVCFAREGQGRGLPAVSSLSCILKFSLLHVASSATAIIR